MSQSNLSMIGTLRTESKMNSRERILSAIKSNQPRLKPLPKIAFKENSSENIMAQFKATLEKIGGRVVYVNNWQDIKTFLKDNVDNVNRMVTPIPELLKAETDFEQLPHVWHDVDLAIFQGHFAVAENGAVWITDDIMGDRALPFICQHIALVVDKEAIVPTMHEAYERIGSSAYHFGTFIAGPSKTADIEQSLVLGAHGPKSMIVFLK